MYRLVSNNENFKLLKVKFIILIFKKNVVKLHACDSIISLEKY
jgi:hypothetical protein